MLLRVKDLHGDSIEAEDGQIGSMDGVVFDDERWSVRYLVVETGGWLSGRRVLVAASAAEHAAPRRIRVHLTREQIEKSPEEEQADRSPLCSTSRLIGYSLETPDGAIGHVADFVVDDATWQIADMVVDTSNWFPGGKRVLVPPTAVARIDLPARKVHVRLSRDEIRNSPESFPPANAL